MNQTEEVFGAETTAQANSEEQALSPDVPYSESKESGKRRKVFGVISLVVVVLLFLGLTAIVWKYFAQFANSGDEAFDAEQFKAYLEGFGWTGRFVLLGLQILQVVIALIPGELVEIGAGYAFGDIEGTLICMVGVAIASSIIFLLVKRWGIKLVSIFVEPERINQLRFITRKS